MSVMNSAEWCAAFFDAFSFGFEAERECRKCKAPIIMGTTALRGNAENRCAGCAEQTPKQATKQNKAARERERYAERTGRAVRSLSNIRQCACGAQISGLAERCSTCRDEYRKNYWKARDSKRTRRTAAA
jgi:hypothetical protein